MQLNPLQKRLVRIGILILLAGFLAAAFVYRQTANEVGDAVGYELADGNAYAVSPADSKRYVHDLELYGGKAAVFADEFNRWFASLWHGRQLACTLAVLAIGAALLCFLAAGHIGGKPSIRQPEDRDG